MSTLPQFFEVLDGELLVAVREPANFVAGDTVKWTRRVPNYPSGTYTLSYTLINRDQKYTVDGDMVTSEGDGFQIIIPAATTAAWLPGRYRWQAYVADTDGNRYTVGEGEIEILPDLQAAPGGIDDREQCEKDLEAVCAMLSGKLAAGDAQRYVIHGPNGSGRELQRYTFAELRKLKGQLEREVRAVRIRRGERVSSRSIGVRFGNGF